MSNEKLTRMIDKHEVITRQFQHVLSKYSRYVPDVPKVRPKFIASLAKNTSIKESMNMIKGG